MVRIPSIPLPIPLFPRGASMNLKPPSAIFLLLAAAISLHAQEPEHAAVHEVIWQQAGVEYSTTRNYHALIPQIDTGCGCPKFDRGTGLGFSAASISRQSLGSVLALSYRVAYEWRPEKFQTALPDALVLVNTGCGVAAVAQHIVQNASVDYHLVAAEG